MKFNHVSYRIKLIKIKKGLENFNCTYKNNKEGISMYPKLSLF